MDELLTLLQNNARTSVEDLARELGTTPADVADRIDRYERDGVIRGYRAMISDDLTADDRFDRIARRISGFDEVVNMYLMSGKYDLLLFVSGKNLRQVASFVSERLSTLDGVLSTGTHFMLKTYKEDGVLMAGEVQYDDRLQVSP